jgi:carboxymethylenebutenolidase
VTARVLWLGRAMTSADTLGAMVDLSAQSASFGGSNGLTGYAIRPPGDEPRPGVVVVHEIFGLDEQARRYAHRLADMGYVVAVPDLFTEGGPRRCLRATFRALREQRGRAVQDIAAARQWLLDRDDTTQDVGIIGFCMGGGFALLCAAPRHGFRVSSVNYGDLPSSPDDLAGACPIVASYGGRDGGLRGAAPKLEYHLTRLGVQHDVKEYPKAGHAFLSDPDALPWFLAPVTRIAPLGPEPESAADAWPRIEAFLAAHLGAPDRR